MDSNIVLGLGNQNNLELEKLQTENINLIFVGIDASGSMSYYVSTMSDELINF